jgi:hypothetical protein
VQPVQPQVVDLCGINLAEDTERKQNLNGARAGGRLVVDSKEYAVREHAPGPLVRGGPEVSRHSECVSRCVFSVCHILGYRTAAQTENEDEEVG